MTDESLNESLPGRTAGPGYRRVAGDPITNPPLQEENPMNVATNYRDIDCHDGSTKMGCFIISVDVNAHVCLQEADDGSLWFKIDYSYSGTKSGSGTQTVGPITGNTSGSKDVRDDVVIKYEISNFSRTDDSVSLDLTASISYTGTPPLGPDSIFQDQRFSGPLSAVQIARSQARMASYVAIHEKLEKALGASVTDLYPRSC